ncbi:hypothetical protein [Marimonas lutisalis]|uniref:hypothetical protein n=1 Tax=Marimonas lutisalis TaxID=2545756 RepID=UPI0010F480F2|nr:hypothetical protein [Marimonas lutisalis]
MTKQEIEAILHIGLHKTGTTSFQAVMHNHRQDFLDAGIDPYRSPSDEKSGRAKHGDLAFAVIRKGVLDLDPSDILHSFDQDTCYERTQKALAAYISSSEYDRFLFSTEALSLLRTSEELERLKSLFPGSVTKFTIIVVLRDKDEWLKSYYNQMIKSNLRSSPISTSWLYFGQGTWLLDFEQTIETYRAACDTVTVLDYDHDDMVGLIARHLRVNLTINTQAYRRNKSARFPRAMKKPRSVFRRIFGSEDQGIRRRMRDWLERHHS